MNQNEFPLEPRHLGVPSGASKMISKPMVLWRKRAPILHRHYCCLQTDRNEIQQDPRHLGVSSGACKMISEPMVCSVQTKHLSCVKISTISKQTEISFRLSLNSTEYHRVHPKWFYEPMLYSAQTVHIHCIKISTISKGPKWASTWTSSSSNSIGCIEKNFLACGTFAELVHLSCTYTNTISKRTEMRFEFHQCVQNNFWAYGMFGTNCAPILRQD
jgi:hypothetical protein